MADYTLFSLGIDGEHVYAQIAEIEAMVAAAEKSVNDMRLAAIREVNNAIHYARMGWNLIQGVIRAAGGSISMTQRLVLSAGFGAIQAIAPILMVEGSLATLRADPIAIARVITGFAQLASATAALIAYEMGSKDVSKQLRGVSFAIDSIDSMLMSWGRTI